MSGYGIKLVEGKREWWITETGESTRKNARGIWKFDSEAGAQTALNVLQRMNPEAVLKVVKF